MYATIGLYSGDAEAHRLAAERELKPNDNRGLNRPTSRLAGYKWVPTHSSCSGYRRADSVPS